MIYPWLRFEIALMIDMYIHNGTIFCKNHFVCKKITLANIIMTELSTSGRRDDRVWDLKFYIRYSDDILFLAKPDKADVKTQKGSQSTSLIISIPHFLHLKAHFQR